MLEKVRMQKNSMLPKDLLNKLMLEQNNELKCNVSCCNVTSPNDVSKILEYIYNSRISKPIYNEALFILSHQVDRKAIPSGIPANIRDLEILNKTGTLSNNKYDAAIIKYKGKAYILVIAVSSYNPEAANNIIAQITSVLFSNYIYNH